MWVLAFAGEIHAKGLIATILSMKIGAHQPVKLEAAGKTAMGHFTTRVSTMLISKILFYLKFPIFVKKLHFCQKITFLSKNYIFVKKLHFCQKITFLSKIYIFVQNLLLCQKFTIFEFLSNFFRKWSGHPNFKTAMAVLTTGAKLTAIHFHVPVVDVKELEKHVAENLNFYITHRKKVIMNQF